MTIKQFAVSHGVSEQAVYQKVKRLGIAISTLKDNKTKQLTSDGISTLQEMFTNVSKQAQTFNNTKSTLAQLQDTVQNQQKTISSLQSQINQLRSRIQELSDEKDGLLQSIDSSRSELESVKKELSAAIANGTDLQTRVDGLVESNQLLTAERDRLLDETQKKGIQLDHAQILVQNAQQLQAAAQQQLAAYIEYQQLPGIVRFFRHLTGKSKPQLPPSHDTESSNNNGNTQKTPEGT